MKASRHGSTPRPPTVPPSASNVTLSIAGCLAFQPVSPEPAHHILLHRLLAMCAGAADRPSRASSSEGARARAAATVILQAGGSSDGGSSSEEHPLFALPAAAGSASSSEELRHLAADMSTPAVAAEAVGQPDASSSSSGGGEDFPLPAAADAPASAVVVGQTLASLANSTGTSSGGEELFYTGTSNSPTPEACAGAEGSGKPA